MKLYSVVSVGLLAGLATMVSPSASAGQDSWRLEGATAPDAASHASSGEFGVMQFAVTDEESLKKAWLQETPGAELDTQSRMRRNQPIITHLIFHGCKAGPAGRCKVTVRFRTLRPNGKLYDEGKGGEVWSGPPDPNPQALLLAVAGYGLRIEDKDPLGPYRVQCLVTDEVAGVTLKTEEVLTAVAGD